MRSLLPVAAAASALIGHPASAQYANHRFECNFSLIINQNPLQLSDPTPVSIAFTTSGSELSEIHVIDAGGILFPGGNMQLFSSEGVTRLEAVEFPAERPGDWSGTRGADRFSFSLTHEGEEVVEFVLTTEPRNDAGEHIVIWNASNVPPGMPEAIRGGGAGYCQPSAREEALQ